MRMLKVLSLIVILGVISLCFLLPKPSDKAQSPTLTDTLPPFQVEASPTPEPPKPDEQPSPTHKTQKASPTAKAPALIASELEVITLENLPDLAVIGEIPYSEVYPEHLIFDLSVSREGTRMLIRSQNWETRKTALVVWDLVRNVQLMAIEDPPEAFGNVNFSPDGDQLWTVRRGALDQYDLHDGSLVDSISLPGYTIAAVSPDGRSVFIGNYDSQEQTSIIEGFSLGSLETRFSEVMAYMISRFHFSPDNRLVAGTSATIGNTVTKVWEVSTGEEVMEFYGYTGGPVFSPDSSMAALVKGREFSIYATDSWTLVASFQNDNPASTNQPKFIFGGNQILAIQETTRITFNNVNTGAEVLAPSDQITLMTTSPALNVIFSNTNLENIKVWGVVP